VKRVNFHANSVTQLNMIKILFTLLVLFTPSAFAEVKLEVKNASKTYDVLIEVESCEDKTCEGKATFTLFKKGRTVPFQVFRLDDTSFMLGPDDVPSVNTTSLYDKQSAVRFADYNFDGVRDLALCDGRNGGYGSPSYQIYLFSPRAKKFINSVGFTELAQGEGMGMFEVDRKKRLLRTSSKSGCCLHMEREYAVVRNRPKKIFEVVEDATIANEKEVKITTKRLVGGRWRTTVKYVPRIEQ